MKNCNLLSFTLVLIFIALTQSAIAQNPHTFPITSTDSNDFSDLTFMDSLVANKDIVFLGESSHGVIDFNEMKFRLIRYLHERHGFSLVVFEAGVHEAAMTNILRDSLTSLEMLTQSLMGFWRVESNCAMMKYMADNQIDIAGMDLVSHALPPKKALYKRVYEDQSLADRFFLLDSLFYFGYRSDRSKFYFDNKDAAILDNDIESLGNYLIENYEEAVNELKQKQRLNLKTLVWANTALISEIQEMNDMRGRYHDYLDAWRDSTMALNLQYALDSIYPNQKTIVWAHDAHIAKTAKHQSLVSIGKYLDKSVIQQSVFIGLGATNGTNRYGMSQLYPIKLKRRNIERKYKQITTKGVYVPVDNLDLRRGKNAFGHFRSEAIQDMYDGFIILKDVRGGELIRYNGPHNCE